MECLHLLCQKTKTKVFLRKRSVSEESDSAEVSESESDDSAETADEDEPSWTVHISFRPQELRLNFPKTQLTS